ncbi:AMP-binding protein [Nocardia sp. NPDC004568]|uniref:AMP-binding protein n=1 Tax=Nocardia sp. NPDC004568 TaxID=3154551 RepID=UPI0033BAB4E2
MVNVAAEVWEHGRTTPERVAVRSPRRITFGELRAVNARVAGAVRDAGLVPLDRVLFIAPSIPEFVEIYYGLHAAGVTVITMNTMSTIPEIGYVFDDSGAELVIAWHENAANAASAAAERGTPFWEIRPGASFDSAPLTRPHDHAPDDTACILYTSGTSGRPKGAELTASNLLETATAFQRVLNLRAEDRYGTALPLFHVFGQADCLNAALVAGASFSLVHPFDAAAVLEVMVADRLTVASGVPTMWNAMVQVDNAYTPADFAHLRVALSGGAPLPAATLRAFQARFECTILEGYGLTESTGGAAFSDVSRPTKTGTVGPALPGTELEIRDSDGAVVTAGVTGEVFLRGPTIMKGYWNRPDVTAAELRDGWLRTGDLGSLDDDGYLNIVDRVKDLIIRGGYNVYPREVEEVLYQHPSIVEVAVIGVPDDHYGEEIAAVTVLRADAVETPETIRAWAKERLSPYKVPRLFSFVEALPKGGTGKILKRAIDREGLRRNTTGDRKA